jgi:hypothetical protein
VELILVELGEPFDGRPARRFVLLEPSDDVERFRELGPFIRAVNGR